MIVCAPAITAVMVALAIAAPGAGGSELSTALGAIALARSGDRKTASPDSRWDRAVCTKPLGAPLRVGMRDERAPRSRPPGSRLGRTASAIRWRRLAVALRANRRSQRTGDRRTPVTRREP